jgi:hypothetical protein
VTRRPAKARAARKTKGRASKARKPKAMRTRRDPLDAMIAEGARSLGLTVEPHWLPEVRSQLAVTLRHGASVAEFRFPDDSEPGPVFEA